VLPNIYIHGLIGRFTVSSATSLCPDLLGGELHAGCRRGSGLRAAAPRGLRAHAGPPRRRARSRAGWDVPDWALAEAASYSEIPDAGHVAMVDALEAFAAALVTIFG
jgi:hypothetical protein